MTSNHVAAPAAEKNDVISGYMVNGHVVDVTAVEQKAEETQDSSRDQQCGCGPYKPKCLQVCAVPSYFLFCMCLLVLVQSFIVSGYSSSILTTIERRYDLWSSELGLIISSYDITAVLAGIIVSYFGDAHNRARWLSRGAVLICLGSLGFSLPHFIGGKLDLGDFSNVTDNVGLCNYTKSDDTQTCDETDSLKKPETWALAVFMVSFMLVGVGASPVYTLGPTYLYDNVKAGRYPVYSGIMYSMGALGPAAGFLVGAAFLELYVHVGEAPAGLTSSHPAWIGAWWIGFIITALLSLLIAVPLALFPKELPGQSHGSADDRPTFAGFGSHLKDFPKYLRKLMRNLSWLAVTFVVVIEYSIGTGFNRFIAKYMELSFNLPPTTANILTGCVLIPAAVLGILTGGVIMNKLNPSMVGTAKVLLALNLLPTIALATLFALGCDSINIVGVTDSYSEPQLVEQFTISYKANLTAPCNAGCRCDNANYEPVCGSNLRTYYSPCYAGCTLLHTYITPDGTTVRNYSSCACIYDQFVHSSNEPGASTGRCDRGCKNLIPFLCILFFVVFMTTCGQNPALIMTLKAVNPNSRSFALGMQNFFSQMLAFIPAPIYFGQIFDSQCILWTPTCEGEGACMAYDIKYLPYVLFGTCLGLKALTFLFLILLYFAVRRRENTKETYEITESNVTTGSTLTSNSQNTSVSTVSLTYSALTSPGDVTRSDQ